MLPFSLEFLFLYLLRHSLVSLESLEFSDFLYFFLKIQEHFLVFQHLLQLISLVLNHRLELIP